MARWRSDKPPETPAIWTGRLDCGELFGMVLLVPLVMPDIFAATLEGKDITRRGSNAGEFGGLRIPSNAHLALVNPHGRAMQGKSLLVDG